MNDFYTALKNAVTAEAVRTEEEMAKHTTFRAGGTADYYISVNSAEQLQKGLEVCKQYGVVSYVLGNGSNVLVSDKGIRGAVFQFGKDFSEVSVNGTEVTVQAGMLLSQLGQFLLQKELAGFAFAAGIPGTVGGAVYMNAGAYGGEIKDILKQVTVLTHDLQVVTMQAEELQLGYRKSILMEQEAYVLEAVFSLTPGNYQEIKEEMDDLAGRRREKQPLEYPSAGSTFKRPEGYFAGKLIQDAGLSGYRVGGAMVSTKHCGFVINAEHATAQDIYQLTEDVKRIVQEKFQVSLEREIRLLGEFPCC